MIRFWTLSSYQTGLKALSLARTMHPEKTWYLTNERVSWEICCRNWN